MWFESAGVLVIAAILVVFLLKITFKVVKFILILLVLGGAAYFIANALGML